MNKCRFVSEYNVACFVTNQMTADPGAGMTYVSQVLRTVFILSVFVIFKNKFQING